MFSNPLWQQLHTKIARYIAPYDAAVRPYSLQLAQQWIAAAEAQHQQILVAFYHSEYTPMSMPNVTTYTRDVQKFISSSPKSVSTRRGTRPTAARSRTCSNRLPRLNRPSTTRRCGLSARVARSPALTSSTGPPSVPRCATSREFKRDIERLKVPMPQPVGAAQLLRHQPLPEHPHAGHPESGARPGVAHGDRVASSSSAGPSPTRKGRA